MKPLRHTAEPGQKEPAGAKPCSFRLFEGMRERRYKRIVRDIQTAERQLDVLAEKRKTFSLLAISSQASIVNEDESNWDEAMANAQTYAASRKALKSESRSAAFGIFTKTMFTVGTLGAASLVMLHMTFPGMGLPVAGAIGALFTLGALMRTWGIVTTGSEEFVNAVSANLEERKAALESERRKLIKALHGWTRGDK